MLRHRRSRPTLDADEAPCCAPATDLGAPLCDGLGDAVSWRASGTTGRTVDLGYRILQGARLRTTWTEFISCPSCGRTLFDLEDHGAHQGAHGAPRRA